MTEIEFNRGYWYATELRAFAVKAGIPAAARLRKDQLEAAVKNLLRGRTAAHVPFSAIFRNGPRDIDQGLRLDPPVVRYTSNRETKQFIEREAAKIEHGFKRASGTRYLLNRWREKQMASGRKITYRDLVLQAITLNKTKRGPLRIEHGRYINFISDFLAQNRGAPHADAVKAWHEVKAMDVVKTYAEWARVAKRKTRRLRTRTSEQRV
jgi:SAP domain-containing new25